MMTKNYIAVVLFCISFLCEAVDYQCVDKKFSAEINEKNTMVRLLEFNGGIDVILPKQKNIHTVRHVLYGPPSMFSIEGDVYAAVFFKDDDLETFEEIAFKKFGVNSINKLIENPKHYDCRELHLFFRQSFGTDAANQLSQKTSIFNNVLIQYSKKYKYFHLLMPDGDDLYQVHIELHSSSAFKDMYDFFAIEP
ncbi:hypothetical protein [Aliikangiella sp. IMCC44632]